MVETTINITGKHICAECTKWKCGDYWGSGSGKHGVLVESKGWCLLKKNKRKRWNYHKACNCLDLREQDSFIVHGCGLPTQEDVDYISKCVETFIKNRNK